MIVWNEPMYVGDQIVGNKVCRATEADIIAFINACFPDRNYTDEDALYEYCVVHWAWSEEGETLPAEKF